jgi:hypothetical protein
MNENNDLQTPPQSKRPKPHQKNPRCLATWRRELRC